MNDAFQRLVVNSSNTDPSLAITYAMSTARSGVNVALSSAGDAGVLNLRAEPSLAAPVNYVALEREVFQVQAGPQDANGFTWWYLVDPATNTKFGWAVQNYLQAVTGP